MQVVKSIIWSIVLYVFLQVLTVLADRLSPNTTLFHQTLLQALQWVLILWLVYAIVFGWLFYRNKSRRKPFAKMVLVFVLLLALGEVLCIVALRNPNYIPGFAMKGFNQYYVHINRNVIQVVEDCAEYDPQLYYRLHPSNTCTFSNVEFNNKVTSNKAGLRDDDASLVAPEIISLGDSYTLGWGVEQNESYPAKLESITGKKVLNAGMSSFGTPREMRLLSMLDTSNLKYITIQYCANDIDENQSYFANKSQLKISSKESYDSLVTKFKWGKVYFPGKYFLTTVRYFTKETIKDVLNRKGPANPLYSDPDKSARMFLDVLKTSPINFGKTKVLLMDMNEYENQNPDFIKSVNKLLSDSAYGPQFKNNLQTIDITQFLTRDDYYLLDGHLKAAAHEKVARELSKHIQ
jgi:hypothetical protein